MSLLDMQESALRIFLKANSIIKTKEILDDDVFTRFVQLILTWSETTSRKQQWSMKRRWRITIKISYLISFPVYVGHVYIFNFWFWKFGYFRRQTVNRSNCLVLLTIQSILKSRHRTYNYQPNKNNMSGLKVQHSERM